MSIIILGSQGNIGSRLMAAFPGAIGIDRVDGAEIVTTLAEIDYESEIVRAAFEQAEGLIHVATSPIVEDPDAIHWQAVVDTARLLTACDRYDIARVVIPSSDWADPKTRWAMFEQNAYGHSKRVFEAMAHMYNTKPGRHCVALRFGWVAADIADYEAADPWLKANYWDTDRLIAQVTAALGT
ncbi:MAG: NAD(P)-dependent oxidoreductase [Devosia sp.]